MVRNFFSVAALLALAIASTLTADVDRYAPPLTSVARAELRTISTRLEGALSQVLIEASEPVAYVTSQPDPLTVLVDLRNVKPGMLPPGILGPLPPVADVRVEGATAGDGAEVARVRVKLAYPAAHRVRSARNVIYVEVDRGAAPQAAQAGVDASTSAPTGASAAAPSGAMADKTADRPMDKTAGKLAASEASPVAAVASAAPGQQPAPPQTVPQRFQGNPVTLDFQGADLRSVLRTFAEISGLNIVIDPAITGVVDVSLRDVPWDQALDIILKSNKLGYVVDGTVVRIAPIAVLASEEEERRKLSEAQALAGELRVLTLPLSYAKAPELVAILTRSALSSRGEVQVDTRTNTIIVRDLTDRLTAAAELVRCTRPSAAAG